MIMNSDGNVIVQLLESMDGARWLILGVVLLVAEVLTGTTSTHSSNLIHRRIQVMDHAVH